jgi:ferredoxin|uniref:PDZ domain-containing protein n=1 Tax=Phaeodactylum tricornutum TaxID=2850 RepID=A0A8J9SUE3_PHATR
MSFSYSQKFSIALVLCLIVTVKSFRVSVSSGRLASPTKICVSESSTDNVDTSSAFKGLDLSLVKPLGMILEEVEEGAAKGVFVKEVAEEGSSVPYADEIVGLKLITVAGEDVTSLTFDEVMDKIINSPETVDLRLVSMNEIDSVDAEEDSAPAFEIGTSVTIKLLQEGKDDLDIETKVGDNLRQVLLDNSVEVYQGMNQKLGNCGGGGQCTFCAFDFVDSEGWAERSDYESQKLKKNPDARLTCLNNIQGPVTIRKAKR